MLKLKILKSVDKVGDKRILEFLLEVAGDLRFNSNGEVFSLNSLEK